MFLFSLGIPAFIQQLAPEDIRHLAQKQMGKWWLALPFLLFAANVALLLEFSHKSVNPEIEKWKEWFAFGIIVFAALALGAFLLSFSKRFNRETVIRGLTSTLHRCYEKTGALDERALCDLISLGISATGGSEKQLVLDAFVEIAASVRANTRYQGQELTKLVRSLLEILDDRERPGDGANYLYGADFLRSILRRPGTLPDWLVLYDDAKAAAQTLIELGLASIRSQRDNRIVFKMLDVGVVCNSAMVYEGGVYALHNGRLLIALYALSKLETEAEKEGGSRDLPIMPNMGGFRLLGLLSHFAAPGVGAGSRAQVYFDRIGTAFFPHLEECLRAARDYFYSRTDFQTADNIAALSAFLKKSKPAPEPLTPEPLI